MIRAAVVGTGRMGRQVIEAILEAEDLALHAVCTRPDAPELGTDAATLVGHPPVGIPVRPLEAEALDCDVVIDFSLPEGLAQLLSLLPGTPLVSGTTGVPAPTRAALAAYAQRAPVIHAANFSTGVNLLLDLAARAARALPHFDVEIIESHHLHKVDAPSGTALALGHAVAEARGVRLDAVITHGRQGQTGARPAGQIGMHALRMGDVAGEHTVWLAGPGERVMLGHVASGRQTFAAGALRAARWIPGKPAGTYQMSDVLGLG